MWLVSQELGPQHSWCWKNSLVILTVQPMRNVQLTKWEHNLASSLASHAIRCKMKVNCRLVRHARTQVMSQTEMPCCVPAFKCQEKYCTVDSLVPCLTAFPLFTSLVLHNAQKSDLDLLLDLSGYLTRNASAWITGGSTGLRRTTLWKEKRSFLQVLRGLSTGLHSTDIVVIKLNCNFPLKWY